MAEISAGEVLAAAALAALEKVAGFNGVYEGAPVKGSLPYATIEIGPASDWSWKGGEGREVRLAVTIYEAGEKPARLRRLMAAVEGVLLGMSGGDTGWRIVNVVMVRARTMQKRAGDWVGTVEVRVRIEREG